MSKPLLQVNNLSFAFGNKFVLSNCTLSVNAGTIVSVLGVNGAGKTTLFNCLTKNLKVKEGIIFYNNHDINTLSYKELSKMVSFIVQLTSLGEIDCIVRDYLVEGRTPYLKTFALPTKKDYLVVEKYAKLMGIQDILNYNLMHLSGGQLQLIAITRALIQETPIIIMDEPMSALDLRNQVMVLKLIKDLSRQGKTIIFTTHNPNHAIALNGEICLLDDGKVIGSGIAKDVLTIDIIREIYGDGFELSNNGYIEINEMHKEKNADF